MKNVDPKIVEGIVELKECITTSYTRNLERRAKQAELVRPQSRERGELMLNRTGSYFIDPPGV